MEFYMKNLLPDEQRKYALLMAEYLCKATAADDARAKHGQYSREYAMSEVAAADVWCLLRPFEVKIGKAWAHA